MKVVLYFWFSVLVSISHNLHALQKDLQSKAFDCLRDAVTLNEGIQLTEQNFSSAIELLTRHINDQIALFAIFL